MDGWSGRRGLGRWRSIDLKHATRRLTNDAAKRSTKAKTEEKLGQTSKTRRRTQASKQASKQKTYAGAEEEVLGLDVAVDDVLLVAVLERA